MDNFFKKITAPSFLIICFLLIAGFLRFYNLDIQSYWIDEGYSINSVLSVLEKDVPILDSGKWYHSEIYAYPAALAVRIFGDNAFAYRFWPAVFGIIFVLVIFIFVKELFGKQEALLSSFFITFSYWQIAWSRQARWYTMFEVFFWLALFFFYKLLKERNKKNLIFLIIFTILTVATHKLGILLAPIYLIWLIVYWRQRKITNKWLIQGFGLLVAAIMIDYWFFNIIIGGLREINFGYYFPYYANWTVRNYWVFLGLVGLLFIMDPRLCEDDGARSEDMKVKIWFVATPFLIYFFSLSFFFNLNYINYRYLFHVYPALIILASIAFWRVWDELKKYWMKVILIIAILAIFFLSSQGILIPQKFYYLESDDITKPAESWRYYYSYTPQPNFNKAYNFIKKNWQEGDIIISAYPQFNKIFLGRAGYWLWNDLNYFNQKIIKDKKIDTEYYVGARVIGDLNELKKIINKNRGFIVLDYMSMDGRLNSNIINYINKNTKFSFFDKINAWSRIWIYEF